MSGGKAAQLARKEGEFIVSTQREVYESLCSDLHFLLHLGWMIQRCGLTDAFYLDSGSKMMQIEGRRQVAVETLNDIRRYVPDVEERVHRARLTYQQDLKKLNLTPEEESRADEEN